MADRSIITKNNKVFLLAYDQGFEHGPTDFNEKNVDPQYILDIARSSGVYSGIIFHEGIAQSYYDPKKDTTPLCIKLNGKTAFHAGEEPYSPQLCSVKEAIRLGAKAVGYTIYIGSEHEAAMMKEFSQVEDEAHEHGLVVVMWAYPRGKQVAGKETSRDVLAYAARLSLELGADFVKLSYSGDIESFKWVVQSAGKTGVLVQGGNKKTEEAFLGEIRECMTTGVSGFAVGRNIWQSPDPIGLSKKAAAIIYEQ
ncbi:MAG: hypothetical protein V1917_01350 [Candidatus Gottesmanbacteria bacterium]